MAEDYTPYSGAYTGAQIDSILAKANASESYTTAEKTKLSTLFNYDDTLVKADISDLKSDKVDKVSGKGLSTNDYTTSEKTKLSGIEAEANKIVVDTSLSSSSTNPVRNSVIKSALDTKVDKVSGKQLSTEDFTTAEKQKLAGLSNYDDSAIRSLIDGKQNALTFDTRPTENSTNPVTSGGVYSEIVKRIPDTMGDTIIDPDPDNGVYADIFTLPIGKYNRQANANLVQNVPSDLGSAAFYCEITNTISNQRREILLFPCTSSAVGIFYRCIELSSGFTPWYKFEGTEVT